MDLFQERDWMKRLRDKLIIVICGDQAEKESVYADIGCCYQCYAPAFLYKYYSDSPQNLESVKNNKMWYSAPSKFNDVFDCDITIDEKRIFDSILKMCPSAQSVRAGSPMWLTLKGQAKQSAKTMSELFSRMRSEMGIACLSESDDSLLMWAHYANSHRGMCVEYELLEINQQLMFTPVPIIYSEDRVCFDSLNTSTIEEDTTRLFLENLTTKSPQWSYEKEWRIIRDDSACGDDWDSDKKGALLNMIRPRSIILGCMANPDFEKQVYTYCDKNRINLFKMERDSQKYQLIKKPLLQFYD